ncbi:MAG: 5-oxoprolinase subunit PxpB [Algibacter sp.]|uniref:5-oxoprolinase subunit PxpB n=1 Tax=Algibacter sp. TaxID=1872428 RepID=UPI002618803F|nr:5-oxoprolinase subunit PxpB [Algibacter sp.]MDG1728361.1 5-oxoprolinase subunit PxpB [Algibacter sp.]MDG2178294.1 5-oxoprolinase subunit PxpB [Algibacter sp.]
MTFSLTYKLYGERSILIEWPSFIQDDILFDLLHFKDLIHLNGLKHIKEIRSAYNSLLVVYDKKLRAYDEEIKVLNAIYKTTSISKKTYNSRLWKIPVCYDAQFAFDIEALSKSKKIPIDEIIKRHTNVIYRVCFIGFLPGFLYLSGLHETLFTPRKATPRLKVEKGAVAIGGNQTGIYPIESPGGWHVIGNSPIPFFNPKQDSPCFAKAGDQVQFYSIDIEAYNHIKNLVKNNTYVLESEGING